MRYQELIEAVDVSIDTKEFGSGQEIINEKVEMVNGTKVLINPSVDVLRNFIMKTEHRSARSLFDGKYFYFWDADKLIHDHMAMELGIEWYTRLTVSGHEDNTFDIYADPRKDFSISPTDDEDYEDEDLSQYDIPMDDTPQVEGHPYYLKLRREG